ncbi:alpha-L-rhamnosidase C-terminal domain-containing protein [Mucisphaera sp.]|uniref:alpha-L-rhamnosidase-related protein n=1 Tax=Mucisphaera sp. TaxID=2913024 RepID=UPI003D0A16D6
MKDLHGLAYQDWRAHWVGLPGDPTPSLSNSWFAYRASLSREGDDGRVIARVAVDSKYWLWINGQLVVFEGGLKRGPTPADTWYDELDLTSHLVSGENCLAVLVWHFGREGFCHKNSGKAGLLFDVAAEMCAVSLSAWRVLRHPSFENTIEPYPNYRLPESNIRFDARRDPVGWMGQGFDDSDWLEAEDLGEAEAGCWGRLYPRRIPQWYDSGIRDYIRVEERVLSGGEVLYVGYLPYNAQVTPYFELEAQAGHYIDIRMDNYRGGSEPNLRSEYITRDGQQRYESFGWLNGHEVHVRVPDSVQVLRMGYRETGYGCRLDGSFRCDDEALNRLWGKSARTLYLNLRDTFFDTPDRERAQWWGDVVLEMTQGFYACDRRFDLLVQKSVRELAAWQREDGVLFSPIPAGNWRDELPMQMLASVGWYGFWTYYSYTGDAETIERVYPAVERYLSLWRLGEDGLVEQRPGDWTWGDWGDRKDLPLLYNGWYALALRGQLAMMDLLGIDRGRAEVECRQASLREHFAKAFFDGTGFRSSSYLAGTYDDRGQALAYLAGLTGEEHEDALRKVLNEQTWASPYMEKYVLEAQLRMGHAGDALARMRLRYRQMIESPITTLWEGWELNTAKYGGGTYNHAWSGGPLELLSRYVAGLDPIEPGWKRYRVRPQMGPLREVAARVPTDAGMIEVEMRRLERGLEMRLVVPDGLEAEVSLGDLVSVLRFKRESEAAWSEADIGSGLRLAAGVWWLEGEA